MLRFWLLYLLVVSRLTAHLCLLWGFSVDRSNFMLLLPPRARASQTMQSGRAGRHRQSSIGAFATPMLGKCAKSNGMCRLSVDQE